MKRLERFPVCGCGRVSRRDALLAGGLSAFGLGLADIFASRRATAAAREPELHAKAKSCILIWLDGGPSHLETFDVKPDAPAEVRGPFDSIPTTVDGIRISEYLPNVAQQMDKIAIIRSMTSPLGEHNLGTHYMMTGYKPSPVLEYATHGAVVAHLRGGTSVLPSNIAVPNFRVGGGNTSGNGFLPASTQPFSVGGDPAKQNFKIDDMDLYPAVTDQHMSRRKRFLAAMDGVSGAVENTATGTLDADFEQAFRLVTSPDAKEAFDLSREPAAVRQRYGPRTIGQCCLLARRLVEGGVSFVTVNSRGWDTHADLTTRLRDGFAGARKPVGLVPSFDLAFAGLVSDLDERGLLEETLIVAMGEFGRTPKLNVSGGRDHWPRVFSVALAGGGIQGGQVVGSSDSIGESPKDRPTTPADLAATVHTQLGIRPETRIYTPDKRPVRVVHEDGLVIKELVG